MVAPMREELTSVGFEQLLTPESVDAAINAEGTVLVMVNSVCGCAAANATTKIITQICHNAIPPAFSRYSNRTIRNE